MLAPSCSSLATCYPRTAGHQVGPTTPIALMTSGLRCSLAPLSRWIYPRTAQWSELECKNFTSHTPHPSSLWLPASTCWGKSSSSHCFWTGMQRLLSPTSSVSTNGPNFHMVAQICPTQQAGRGAMNTRWTCGSGSLGGASLALGGFLWQTQRTIELSSRQTVIGVLLRRAGAALLGRVQSDFYPIHIR